MSDYAMQVMYGLNRRGLVGFAAATVGVGLIARGAIGRCPIYRVLGLVDSSELLLSA